MVETMRYVDKIAKKVKSMMKVENAEKTIVLQFEPKLEPKVMEELDIFINNNSLLYIIVPDYYNTEVERIYWEGEDDKRHRKGDFLVKEVRYDLDGEMEDGLISVYLYVKYWRNKINAFDLVVDGIGMYGDDLYGLDEKIYEKDRREFLKENSKREKKGQAPAWLERYGSEEAFWNFWRNRNNDEFNEWYGGEEYHASGFEEKSLSSHDIFWIWYERYRKK